MRLQRIGNEVEAAAIAHVSEGQKNVSRLRSFKRFVDPTAVELVRLIKPKPGDFLLAKADERANSFARLLNRGSSLE